MIKIYPNKGLPKGRTSHEGLMGARLKKNVQRPGHSGQDGTNAIEGGEPGASSEHGGTLAPGGMNSVTPVVNELYLGGQGTNAAQDDTRNAVFIPESSPFAEGLIDDAVEITLSPDGMEAFGRIIVGAAEGKRAKLDDVSKALAEAKVVFGVNLKAVRALLSNPGRSEWIRVAVGTKPEHGADAAILLHFRTKVTGAAKLDENDRVNFWELDIFEACTKGQILASKTPPTKGEAGMGVTGASIEPQPGRNKPLPKGRGVKESPDGMSLVCLVDGHVMLVGDQIVASDTLVIQRDVDMSTGNIDYAGNVVVRGTVYSGMTVKAGRDIEVYGLVEGVTLEAGGNINLHSGVQASGSGRISCKGNFSARYIERANVEADGTVKAVAMMHSRIESGKFISAEGEKGVIIGGKCIALMSINAKTVGAVSGVMTELELGMPPQRRARHKFLQGEIARVQQEIEKLKHLMRLLGSVAAPGEPTMRTEAREKTVVSLNEDIALLPELLEEFGILCAEFETVRDGRVNVSQKAYKGASVSIGPSSFRVSNDIDFVTFKIDQETGRVSSFPYERSKDPTGRAK